jgi:hypothetical protein
MLSTRTIPGLLVALLIAALLSIAFFALTNGWTALSSVVPGAVAIASGAIGFGAAVMIDRLMSSSRTSGDSSKPA